MKAIQISFLPTAEAQAAGRPALPPETFAAVAARTSRNGKGIEEIIKLVDPNDYRRSTANIFKFVDYGHKSIADMVPVAIAMEGISLYLCFKIWNLCPTASGQENSTRYCDFENYGLIDYSLTGLPNTAKYHDPWIANNQGAIKTYKRACEIWQSIADSNPLVMGIPEELLKSKARKDNLIVQRMKLNYVLDRARYFIPVSMKNNMVMVQSAGAWAELIRHLSSMSDYPEAHKLALLLRTELKLVSPETIRHSSPCIDHIEFYQTESERYQASIHRANFTTRTDVPAIPMLEILDNDDGKSLTECMRYHRNRYSPVGSRLSEIPARYSWSGVSFAEIRDMDRHRTGFRRMKEHPQGFYYAMDQIPEWAPDTLKMELFRLATFIPSVMDQMIGCIRDETPGYMHYSLLGMQYTWLHTTTLDKLIYELELRTGKGTHFRYRKHYMDLIKLVLSRFPSIEPYLLIGSGEPE